MKTFILLLALCIPTSSAWAIKLSLLGGANLTQPEYSPTIATFDRSTGLGGGALLEFGMLPAIGLEIGGLYLPRKFSQNQAGLTYENDFQTIQVPVLLRATLGGVISLGLGGYYAHQPDAYIHSATGLPIALSGSDYGVATSVALYMPFSPISRFMIDGRYNMGAKDVLPGPGEIKFNDLQILVGLQLGM